MNEYNEGDLVEAVNPEGDKLVGRLVRRRTDGNLFLGCHHWTFPSWVAENAGFSNITVIERATPPLPTEPGWYCDKHNDVWRLTDGGRWYVPGGDGYSGREFEFAPFTRLEPVADTAKKVLDRFDAVFGASFISPLVVLKQLREEFGVTS